MPSQKNLDKKKQQVVEVHEKINASAAGVVVDYKGISVAEDTQLRKELRAAGVEYFVVKNSILKRALEGTAYTDMDSTLTGATAIAISTEDPVAAAKVIGKFAESKKGFFEIKTGFVDGKVISIGEVKDLSHLPSREELISKMLAGFNAPISGFANVLMANLRGLVIVLNAIAEKQNA